MSDLERDLERARAIAVALEQENARLTEERDRLLRDLVHEVTVEADRGDVVGVEDLPVGDPWAELGDGPWSDDG